MKNLEIISLKKAISATVEIPGSKSYTNRALILAALTKNTVTILNPLKSDDTEAMIECLKTLGINIIENKNLIKVVGDIGDLKDEEYKLNAKLSGTTIRFILALSCIVPGVKIITGEEGLKNRPISDLVNSLRELGAKIEYAENEGFPPVIVSSGHLSEKTVNINGEKSSQFVSALLMIAPVVGDLKIEVSGRQGSKPFIDMTISLMEDFGVKVKNNKYREYFVKNMDYDIDSSVYEKNEYKTEGDYSSAGYFLAIAALTKSKLILKNLNSDSKQADIRFLEVLGKMGNKIVKLNNGIEIIGKGVKPLKINMEDFPDQVQTLAVLAAFANGVTEITGVKSLRVKETERVIALQNELKKMGIKTQAGENTLKIYGGNPKAGEIDTYGDHRMAMSFAVAGAKLPGMVIRNPEVVNKTFPEFWKKLEDIGIKIIKHVQDGNKKYKRIFLIGFRTTGKTTIGGILAKRLGMELLETDEIIIQNNKMTIDELTGNGTDWKEFRRQEHEIMKDLANKENILISTGGGMTVNDILSDEGKTYGELNEKLLNNLEESIVILLTASNEVIEERIIKGNRRRGYPRPILDQETAKRVRGLKDEQLIRKVVEDSMKALNARKEKYKRAADFVVDTGVLSVEESVDKILKFIKG